MKVAKGVKADRLRRKIRTNLTKVGFKRDKTDNLSTEDMSKESYRAMHSAQRRDKLEKNRKFLNSHANNLIEHFANGVDITPTAIQPRLELIEGSTWQSDLFRFASLQWRIPVSDGYGRRMRFLVWDDSNEKLIGLIALGDAVFNLAARDNYVGWDHTHRMTRLLNVMDAYVLGAVPPYNMLLGGKLVASLIRSQEVRQHFHERYADSVGIISQRKKNARLAMVTTTSALGRSSVYNRLRLDGLDYFRPIGFTSGYGHFHISDSLFDELRDFLEGRGDDYADGHEYGTGPNWRLRVIRRALTMLGMNAEIMKHKLVREVFVCELASNAKRYLQGESSRALFGPQLLSLNEVSSKAIARWVAPRALRNPEFHDFNKHTLLEDLLPQGKGRALRA